MPHIYTFLLFIFSLCLFSSCSSDVEDLFSKIEQIIPSNPKLALERLRAIDPASLSSEELYCYAVLTMRATDNAYSIHDADSTIVNVIDTCEANAPSLRNRKIFADTKSILWSTIVVATGLLMLTFCIKHQRSKRKKIICGYSQEAAIDDEDSKDEPPVNNRSLMQTQLIALKQDVTTMPDIPMAIINSNPYMAIQALLKEDRALSPTSSLWSELEEIINTAAPTFLPRLRFLTGGKLTENDTRISMLIKCGFTPTQLSTLLCKTKGTISYHRETLCMKAFDQKLGVKTFDDIIRLL